MYSPVKGARVSSRYLGGFRSTGGHSGIDFAAPTGSKIYAAVGGRVISVGWGGAYGNLTKIQHDDGTVGYYAHQSRFAVKAGQRIAAGSLLGFVGNTGNSTGSHLHFEVRRNGKPTDPIPFLNFDGKRTGSLSKGKNGGSLAEGKQGGSFMPPQSGMLPDIVQMTDPNDTLAMLEAQGMQASPGGKAAGGFSTPALDAASGKPVEQTDLEQSLGREASLIQQSQMLTAMRKQQEQMAAYQTSMMQATAQQAPSSSSQGSASSGGGASGDLGKLINAIRAKESGGSYSARNRHSGALGAYQIMPGNIASWSKAALGYSISANQFLANPRLQDAIAQHRLGTYFRKYGASGAALAWYAGEGALRYSESARNRKQGSYPSMNSYVQDILRRAGL